MASLMPELFDKDARVEWGKGHADVFLSKPGRESRQNEPEPAANAWEPLVNAFCPTGKGGVVD